MVKGYVETRVQEVFKLIDPYVKEDPNSFYTYEEFVASLNTTIQRTPGLVSFNNARVENIEKQLSGATPSQGNGTQTGQSGTNFGRMGGNGAPQQPGVKPDRGVLPPKQADEMPDDIDILEMMPEARLYELIQEYNEFLNVAETSETSTDIGNKTVQSENTTATITSAMPRGFESTATTTESTVAEKAVPNKAPVPTKWLTDDTTKTINGHEIGPELRAWIMERMLMEFADGRPEGDQMMKPDMGNRMPGAETQGEQPVPDDISQINATATLFSLVLLVGSTGFLVLKRKI